MKDTFIGAKLQTPNTIRIALFSPHSWEKLEAILYIDGENKGKLPLIKNTSLVGLSTFDYSLPAPFELGHDARIFTNTYGEFPLDVTSATTFPGFDEEFYYEGDDLGATLLGNVTMFKLWAPLASHVAIKYRKLHSGDPFAIAEMIRGEKGVYEVLLKGNLAGYEYRYVVTNNGVAVETSDPYAKGSTANGASSVVVDFAKLSIDMHEDCLPVLERTTQMVVYEAHVRDMTISSATDIEHKGTFLGLVEKGRKTPDGTPAGFDYIRSLGINALQLLPIYDYKTVDENHPETKYNWGYDPAQYFVPEGSYASDLSDPLSRIKDCKKMVSCFHEAGIRIIMDVVYNHVYESSSSVFEHVVPNFYFRKNDVGKRLNCSGCGNDFASERPMVRKLIVDACLFWIKTYGIDGFRFDLMGLLDVETLQLVEEKAKKIKPHFALYGEGWNMYPNSEKPMGHMGNYASLPGFGFFNDTYREAAKNFWTGDYGAIGAYKFSLVGSCIDFQDVHAPMFADAAQSINYVECHDNGTFFDFIGNRRKDLDGKKKLELCLAGSCAVLLSLGVPFLHAGEEIGESKWNEDNTYNKGDDYNKFSYRLLSERKQMAETLASFICFRKKARFLAAASPNLVDDGYFVEDKDGAAHLSVAKETLVAPYKHCDFYFNPTDNPVKFPCGYKGKVIVASKAGTKLEEGSVTLPPRSTIVLAE